MRLFFYSLFLCSLNLSNEKQILILKGIVICWWDEAPWTTTVQRSLDQILNADYGPFYKIFFVKRRKMYQLLCRLSSFPNCEVWKFCACKVFHLSTIYQAYNYFDGLFQTYLFFYCGRNLLLTLELVDHDLGLLRFTKNAWVQSLL